MLALEYRATVPISNNLSLIYLVFALLSVSSST